MKNLIAIFQCILCLSAICTNADPLLGESVTQAGANEFPFLASLAVSPATYAQNHFCGGTLISKRHVLTAQHCLVNVINEEPLWDIRNIRVTVGSIDMTRGRKYNVSSWITYEEWTLDNNIISDTIYHDAAVVFLSEDVNDIEPASISQCDHKQIRGHEAVTAGWGVTNYGFKQSLAHKASLHVISRRKCRLNFIRTGAPPYMVLNHLCTTHSPPVVLGCGDSGGPLLIHGNELIGINESVCANDIKHPHEQNSHQSVEYYRKFIEEYATKKAPCSIKCKQDHV